MDSCSTSSCGCRMGSVLPWLLLVSFVIAWAWREHLWQERIATVAPTSSQPAPGPSAVPGVARRTASPISGAAMSATSPATPAANEVWRIGFEDYIPKDWDTGRIFHLPLLIPGDAGTFARPTGDGGNWSVQVFGWSDDSRSGKSLLIQIRNPVRIGGGGLEWWFRGKTAFAPGKRHTASIWAKCDLTDAKEEFADTVLGWAPGTMHDSTIQDYPAYGHQTQVMGWTQISLPFVSNTDPKIGDRLLIAFAARSQKLALNAVFDDLVITQDEP